MIRIIAGEYKGHKLKSGIDRIGLRPTKDRVKESLFSIIQTQNYNRVIDLFAGSGSLGFEALSRGASSVTFVEKNYRQCKIIKENATKLRCEDQINIINSNAFSFFEHQAEAYDLVLVDPPYRLKKLPQLPAHLIDTFPKAQIVLETADNFEMNSYPEKITGKSVRIYGNTKLTFFKVK